MKVIKDMSNKELIDELEAIDQQINDVGVFGINDLQWQRSLCLEAEKRDLEITKEE